MGNFNIEIKRTFVSFAQARFKDHPKYTWQADLIKTKVLILDKYAINLKVLETKRSIVVSRGAYGWKHTSLGQRDQRADSLALHETREPYTDLLRGTITYNCISQQGLVAEEMAHILFVALAGAKTQFRKNGIHQILNINLGEESILKSDSSIELSAVPIYVEFETQKNFVVGFDFYTFVLVDENTDSLYQGAFYDIDATGIHFYVAPASGKTLTATYTHAVTLAEITEPLIGSINGVNKDFTVSYPIYTAYPLFSGADVTVSGVAGNTW